MVRLPEDLEFVLDPFERLALPRSQAVPVSVVKNREQMSQAVYDIVRVTG